MNQLEGDDFSFDQIEITDKSSKKSQKRKRDKSQDSKLNDAVSSPSQNLDFPNVKTSHSVWIGNLSYSTTASSLMKFFEDLSVSRIHLPKEKDKNKGFAFVDFVEAQDVENALKLSEKELEGRKLLIKSGNDYEASGRKARGAKKPKKAKEVNNPAKPCERVFVGNLSLKTTKEMLQKFEKYGPVENIRLAQFEDSGKCKGYAWVSFGDVESAKKAVENVIKIDGRILRVEYSERQKPA